MFNLGNRRSILYTMNFALCHAIEFRKSTQRRFRKRVVEKGQKKIGPTFYGERKRERNALTWRKFRVIAIEKF